LASRGLHVGIGLPHLAHRPELARGEVGGGDVLARLGLAHRVLPAKPSKRFQSTLRNAP
jgi:hypothetical protein